MMNVAESTNFQRFQEILAKISDNRVFLSENWSQCSSVDMEDNPPPQTKKKKVVSNKFMCNAHLLGTRSVRIQSFPHQLILVGGGRGERQT